MLKYSCVEFMHISSQWESKANKNEKQKTKYTSLTLSSAEFHIYSKKYKLFFWGIGESENFQILPGPFLRSSPTHACQLSFNPSRDPVPLKSRQSSLKFVIETCVLLYLQGSKGWGAHISGLTHRGKNQWDAQKRIQNSKKLIKKNIRPRNVCLWGAKKVVVLWPVCSIKGRR
jgi:hypothetical protein